MKKTIDITQKSEYDVIVVGSGPSGIGAALSSGRQGVKTLIIESLGKLGGVATSGMMSHFTGSVGSKLYKEVLTRAAKNNQFDKSFTNVIDPEFLTLTYIQMLEEAHVDILCYTTVTDAILENNKVTGVICYNKGGFFAYRSKVVIDASGDGDVAYKAGVPYCKGRETDGAMQPATLMFKIAGVDMKRAVFPGAFEALVETEKGELQALGKKNLPYPAGHVLLYESTIPGVVTCNMTNAIGIDGTNAEDLTKAEISCRKQIPKILNFLREYAPGYENCYLIGTASLIGIRETRHFKGVECLNEKDILSATQFDDYVVSDAKFEFDVHNITGAGLDETGCQKHFKQKSGYTIPYGCMIPEKVDGLLLSGRNISGTHMAHSSFRSMPICMALGEAGGIAASIAVKHNTNVRDVSPKEIQKFL